MKKQSASNSFFFPYPFSYSLVVHADPKKNPSPFQPRDPLTCIRNPPSTDSFLSTFERPQNGAHIGRVGEAAKKVQHGGQHVV